MPVEHPCQVAVWTALDRVNGSRAMSLDDLLGALRVCVRLGHGDVAERAAALLTAQLAEAARAPAEDIRSIAMETAELAGEASKAAREVTADGIVAGVDDAKRLHELADQLETNALKVRAAAMNAATRSTP